MIHSQRSPKTTGKHITLWIITVAKFQLQSSNENNCIVGVTTAWEAVLMGHSFQQVENHCSRNSVQISGSLVFFFKNLTTFNKNLRQYTISLLCFESINSSHFPRFILHTWPPWGLPLLLLSAAIAVTLSESNWSSSYRGIPVLSTVLTWESLRTLNVTLLKVSLSSQLLLEVETER